MPLASKPPFATDLPDSAYASGNPQRRQLAAPANPNARSSAYDVCVRSLHHVSPQLKYF